MKVTITKETRDILTMSEYDAARRIISDEKDDGMTPKEYAEMIGHAIARNSYKLQVLAAGAEIAKNRDVWDHYGEGTGRLDIWITFKIITSSEYLEGGAYLSDVWALDGSDEKKQALINRAYIRRFVPEN